MIAHDIVDLQLARRNPRILQERFQKKVLQEQERKLLHEAEDIHLSFCVFWAAKEAAYKLVYKLGLVRGFFPKKLIINYLPKIIYYESIYINTHTPLGIYPIRVYTDPYKIEAYAARNMEELKQARYHSFAVDHSNYACQSRTCKHMLIDHLAAHFSLPQEKLEIRKENSIPKVYLSSEKLPIDVSISHHGHWGSFGYTIPGHYAVKEL